MRVRRPAPAPGPPHRSVSVLHVIRPAPPSDPSSAPVRASPVALLLLAACAGAPVPPLARGRRPQRRSPSRIALLVEAGPEDVDLAGRQNDEELFAIGTAAFGAGDHRKAAAAFGRRGRPLPRRRSAHAAALFDAGLSYERLGEWRLALERFRALARAYTGPDADEASFRVAECLWHLRELAEARAVLDGLARRKRPRAPRSHPGAHLARRRRAGRATPRRPSGRCGSPSRRGRRRRTRSGSTTTTRPGPVLPGRGVPPPLPGGAPRSGEGRRGEARPRTSRPRPRCCSRRRATT